MNKTPFDKNLVSLCAALPKHVLCGKTMLDYLKNDVTERVDHGMSIDIIFVHPTVFDDVNLPATTAELKYVRPYFKVYSYLDESGSERLIQIAARLDRYGFALGNDNAVYRPIEVQTKTGVLSFMAAEDALVVAACDPNKGMTNIMSILIGAMYDQGLNPYKTMEKLWVADEYSDMVKRVGDGVVMYHTLLAENITAKAVQEEASAFFNKDFDHL